METKEKEEKLSFQQLLHLFKETQQRIDRTNEMIEKSSAELSAQFKEDISFQDIEKFLQELGKQNGSIGNKSGTFNEELVLSSLSNLLYKNFSCSTTMCFNHQKNGTVLEIDLLGISKDAYYIIEIKSHLREDSIEQLKKEIVQFKQFRPLFEDKKVYGLITATHYDEKIRNKVLEEGIYFISITDDIVKMDVPDNFTAKAW